MNAALILRLRLENLGIARAAFRKRLPAQHPSADECVQAQR
jgi:hypothetical protein